MSSGQFIQWHDLVVIVDDGAIPLPRYDIIEAAMKQQSRTSPASLACLVILPSSARPPDEATKGRIKTLLLNLKPSLSCLAYVIEGSGFKAVAARAALVTLKIFMSRPYPIYVETSMNNVLTKIRPHLKKYPIQDVTEVAQVIANARDTWDGKSPSLTPQPAGTRSK